jgi:rare lipoprotein A
VTVAALPEITQTATVEPQRSLPTPRQTVAFKPVLPAAVTTVPVSGSTRLFVQAGAFVQRHLADRLQRSLTTIGPTRVVEATVGDRRFYRVRVGPVATVTDGDRILDQVVANGHPDARLVVD